MRKSASGGSPRVAPNRFLLLKDGDLEWTGLEASLDAASAKAVMDHFAGRGNQLVIDYNHQTLDAEEGKDVIPEAAGWIRSLRYVPGEGLWAEDVEWTEQAAELIEQGAFKYISPVIHLDKKKQRPATLHSCALTNRPRTENMVELLKQAASQANELVRCCGALLELRTMSKKTNAKLKGVRQLVAGEIDDAALQSEVAADAAALEKFLAELKQAGVEVADDAPLADVLSAALTYFATVKKKESAAAEYGDVAEALGLGKDSAKDAILAEIKAWKVRSAQADAMSKRLEVLEAQAKEQAEQSAAATAKALIDAAIERGHLLPDDKSAIEAATELARENPKRFEKLFAGLPSVPTGSLVRGTAAGGPGDRRAKVIQSAKQEFANNRSQIAGAERGTLSVCSWIDAALDDEGLRKLSASECEALKKESN